MESKRKISAVRYTSDVEDLYKQAIKQNIEKRDRCKPGTDRWKAYNRNIIRLEQEIKEIKNVEKNSKTKEISKPEKKEMKKEESPKRLTHRERKLNEKVDNLIRKARIEAAAKYRGSDYLNRKYDEAMKRYKSHIFEKSFQIRVNRRLVTGRYKTVRDYPNRIQDEKVLNFQKYKETLERVTKAQSLKQKGIELYKNTEFSYEKDKEYLETNNYTYSQYKQTRESLKTLGYFGKKSRLFELKKGQHIRNILRAGINITGYVRNHTIVPVSEFIGKNIALKVYDVTHKILFENKNGVYKNRRTHRYEARKQYFLSQGKGYIKSIYYSIKYAKQTDKEIIENKNREIEKEYQNYRDELLNASIKERKNIRKPHIKTDPISEEIRNRTNEKNVTRIISGIKIIAIAGISYIGPRISKAILDKTSHERILTTQSIGKERIVQTQKLVKGKTTKVIDREKLENLTIKELVDLNDNKVATYGGGIEKEVVQAKLKCVRGIAENDVSMADRNISNIEKIANSIVPDRFLGNAGYISRNTKILDLVVANRNQSLGTNTTKKEILDEILESGTQEQQMQKLQEIFNNIYFLKSTSKSKSAIGWNSLGNEFANIKERLYKVINNPPHWETVTKKIKGKVLQEILKGHHNSKVTQRFLNGLGNTMRATRAFEVIDLIYENSRDIAQKRQMEER